MPTTSAHQTTENSPSYGQVQIKQLNHQGFESLVDMFDNICAEKAHLVAYSCMGKELTFGEIRELSRNVAAYLVYECGLKPGDRIAMQLPNILQYPVMAWGAMRAGLVIVNTNPMYTPREMLHQFNDAGVKALVVLSELLPKAEAILEQTSIETIIATSALDFLNVQALPKSSVKNLVSFMEVLDKGKDLSLPNINITMDDVALLQYTGGTTGVAKGATLTQGNLFGGLTVTRNFFKEVMVEREVVIAPMPLYHVYGFTTSVISVFLYGGMSVLIPNPADTASLVTAMKTNKATGLAGVNTLFQSMMAHPEFDDIDFSHMTGTIAGGAALIKEVAEEWKARTGQEIFEGYGLSETAGVLSCNIEGKRKLGTVGLPYENMQVKLIDDQGRVVSGQGPGELCMRGPQVMTGYWNREPASQVIDRNGWFMTGDVAVIDSEGFIKIVDRISDMVLVSGFNVYPNEIEKIVYAHPDVVECAVIGVPDDKTGEAVKLFVKSSNSQLTGDDLQTYCRKELTGYKVPKLIEFMADLPKTPVGKVLRSALRN